MDLDDFIRKVLNEAIQKYTCHPSTKIKKPAKSVKTRGKLPPSKSAGTEKTPAAVSENIKSYES